MLEHFRTEAGSLTEPLVANRAGGTLRVELNHQDTAGLPAALASDGLRQAKPAPARPKR